MLTDKKLTVIVSIMADTNRLFRRYSAAELAAMTGITPRRLRYYVREKLIDPPLGLGRGRHYNCGHLAQLRRVVGLRRAGLGHAAIRADSETLRRLLASKEIDSSAVYYSPEDVGEEALAPGAAMLSEPERVMRLRMAPGIELLVDQDRDLPTPDQLLALARAVRAAFGVEEAPMPKTGGDSVHLR